jgi:hypothetical protein
MDRTLEKLPEVDGTDRDSIMLRSEDGFVGGCKRMSPDYPEAPLKPVREFYREQIFHSSPVTNKLSFMAQQGRRLVLALVVHQDFIQLSCLWSFISCALLFSFYYYYQAITNAHLVVLRIFFFILILASLSTVIDMIRGRTVPLAFGTQHFAILLVAWCPAVVFGSSTSPIS